MSVAWALNTAWMCKCRRETIRYQHATTCVEQAQQERFQQIIRLNRGTEFGNRYRFDKIKTIKDFQRRVPLGDYDSHAASIDRIARGEENILTGEPVQLLEPTSGSTHGAKLIPYTQGLRKEFQRAIAAWIGDLFYHRPKVRHGRAYWSISPAFGSRRLSTGGVPIGFDDDTAYLSSWERPLVGRLLATPPSIAKAADVETFRYQTLLHLLATKDLALISIWSPTFLSSLLSPVDTRWDQLLGDMRQGFELFRPNARRADELQPILASHEPLAEKLRFVWPRLALLSCWADAASATLLPVARNLLPHVDFQPKGLISTEAFVSIPIVGQSPAALAIRSHFFEFKEPGSDRCRLAHQLELDGKYEVVVTTAGGLYRYQLYDEVIVRGFFNDCPLLQFAGRNNHVSDLVGEKLSESHMRRVLDGLLDRLQLLPVFAMLVPVIETTPHYRLYLQTHAAELDVGRVAELLERGLHQNPHYALAVALGQLAPVDVRVPDAGKSLWSVYERRRLSEGLQLGDIKPTILDPWRGWDELFQAQLDRSS